MLTVFLNILLDDSGASRRLTSSLMFEALRVGAGAEGIPDWSYPFIDMRNSYASLTT